MDVGTFAGIATIVSMLGFVLTVAWALSKRRSADFDRIQMLPLEEDSRS